MWDSATTNEDFFPFLSKRHALLFLLMNGPRPMVLTNATNYYYGCYYLLWKGENNLKFMWFTLKECDTSIPSFDEIKRLSLPKTIVTEKVSRS